MNFNHNSLGEENFRYETYLVISIAAFTAIMSYFSWVRYMNLDAFTFDLGVKLQTIFTSLNGVPIDRPNQVISYGTYGPNFFTIHFSPLSYVLSPFLHLFPSVITLFVVQWLFIGLTSIYAYKISVMFGISKKMALAMSFAVLIYPPSLMSGMYDVHFLSFFPLCSLAVYYYLYRRKYIHSLFFVILGFSTQESFMLLLPFIFFQLAVDQLGKIRNVFTLKKWNLSTDILVIASVASIIVFLAELQLMQFLDPSRTSLITSDGGYGIAVQNLLTNIVPKLEYYAVLFGLFLFIPFFGLKKWVIAFPGLILGVFSIHNFASLYWQYSFVIIPGVYLMFIWGARSIVELKNNKRRTRSTTRDIPAPRKITRTARYRQVSILNDGNSRVFALVISVLIVLIIFNPASPAASTLPQSRTIDLFTPPSDWQVLNEIVGMIPQNATVVASDSLFPHIAMNPNAYPIEYATNLQGEYVLYNYTPPGVYPSYIFITPNYYEFVKQTYRNFTSNFNLIAEADYNGIGVLLYKYHYSGKTLNLEPEFLIYNASSFTPVNDSFMKIDGVNVIVANITSHPALQPLFEGPSTATNFVRLIPGNYSLNATFLFNNTANLTFKLAIYGNHFPKYMISASVNGLSTTYNVREVGKNFTKEIYSGKSTISRVGVEETMSFNIQIGRLFNDFAIDMYNVQGVNSISFVGAQVVGN